MTKKNIAIFFTLLFLIPIFFSQKTIAANPNIVDPVDGKCAAPADFVIFPFKLPDGTIFKKCFKKDSAEYQRLINNYKEIQGAYEASAAAYDDASCVELFSTGDAKWNPVAKKCETEGSVFYNTLNTIYSEGTEFVSGLVSKSGGNQYKVIVDIPCDPTITKLVGGVACSKTQNYTNSIPLYITRLYQFGFGIVGAVALLMIIIGAAKYTLSAGNFTSKDEAKQQITEAIYGILLLFGAYLVLYTINPELTKIKAPTLTSVDVSKFLTTPKTQTSSNTNTPSENSGTAALTNCNVPNADKSSCIRCNDKYILIASGRCISIPVYCIENNGSSCTKCATGYSLVSGSCIQQYEINAACSSNYNGPNGKCLPCEDGYIESNKKCIRK